MKNKKTFAIILIASLGLSVGIIQGFNPFSRDDWEDVGEKIAGGFKKAVNFLGDKFEDMGKLVETAFKKVKECTAVVGLGTKWAAKKAAYETAKASVELGDKLKGLDPRVVGLQVAEETAKAGIKAAKASLEVAEKSAMVTSKILEGIATGAKEGINVKKISFETYMSKLLKGEGPRFQFVATILGQDIKEDITIDLSKPLDAAKDVMEQVIEKIKDIG